MSPARETSERCTFCEKTRAMVECLIAGPPGTYICSDCVALCTDILSEEKIPTSKPGVPALGLTVVANTLAVTAVVKDGPAARAGLKVGDVLEHDVRGVRRAISAGGPDGCVTINVRRGTDVDAVVIQLDSAPEKLIDL